MLAWALTIHKAQGLTLDRIIIDAADDEKNVGLLFVAMTRVRHPSNMAFDPMPSLKRITETIAKKPQLELRKMHDRQLRTLARNTGLRMRQLGLTVPETTFQSPASRSSNSFKAETSLSPAAHIAAISAQLDSVPDAEYTSDTDFYIDTTLNGDVHHKDEPSTSNTCAADTLVRMDTAMTITDLRALEPTALDGDVQMQLKYASSISAFLNLPDVRVNLPSQHSAFFTTLMRGLPRSKSNHNMGGAVSHIAKHPDGKLKLSREFLCRVLSDTNTANGSLCDGSSW